MIGTVSRFDDAKGWGFITDDGGAGDFFVHYTAIMEAGHKTLYPGQRVEFERGDSQRGPQAARVIPLDGGPEGEARTAVA
jgi:CspA family cold shock protein